MGIEDFSVGLRLARSISACRSWGTIAPTTLGRHAILQIEYVLDLALETLGPDMRRGRGVDELPGDADARARLAHAAFQHVAHAKLAADLLHVDGAALVGEGRIARDDEDVPGSGTGP